MARQETRHVTGASFAVTIARANKNSSLPAYKDRTSRRQWKVGSLLVFKRPAFIRPSDTSSIYLLRPGLAGPSGYPARVTRTLISEL